MKEKINLLRKPVSFLYIENVLNDGSSNGQKKRRSRISSK